MVKNIKMDNKIETITLLAFKCSNCQQEFLSNAQSTVCTICGADLDKESCIGSLEAIDKKDLNKKIDEIIKSLENISEKNDLSKKGSLIQEFVLEFMNEKNIKIPSGKSLIINLDWEYDETPWQFLGSVEFNFLFKDKENIEEELKAAINDNFSISEMAENSMIVFNQK